MPHSTASSTSCGRPQVETTGNGTLNCVRGAWLLLAESNCKYLASERAIHRSMPAALSSRAPATQWNAAGDCGRDIVTSRADPRGTRRQQRCPWRNPSFPVSPSRRHHCDGNYPSGVNMLTYLLLHNKYL